MRRMSGNPRLWARAVDMGVLYSKYPGIVIQCHDIGLPSITQGARIAARQVDTQDFVRRMDDHVV